MKYYNDPYLFESKQKVIDLIIEDDNVLLKFDDTIFYPGGGGQPCDLGIMQFKGNKFDVISVSKRELDIYHTIKKSSLTSTFSIGSEVTMFLDIHRRTRHMKMHSGEHLFMGVLESLDKDVRVHKIDIGVSQSDIYIFKESGDIDLELFSKAEIITNNLIETDLEIASDVVGKEIVEEKYPGLRIKLDRIKSDSIRVINIKTHDISACAGVHATRTSELKNFHIKKISKIKDKYVVTFEIDNLSEIISNSILVRDVASSLKCNKNELLDEINKLKSDNDYYVKSLRKFMSDYVYKYESEKIRNVKLNYSNVDNFDKKLIVDEVNKYIETNEIYCIFNHSNKMDLIPFTMVVPLNFDVKKFISFSSIRGGGSKQLLTGVVDSKEVLLSKIKAYLSQ